MLELLLCSMLTMLLRVQALLLPVKTLALSGH